MNQARRKFLASAILLPGGLTRLRGLAAGRQSTSPPITSPNSPFNKAFDFSSLTGWITTNDDFFIRSHFGVPATGPAWTLKVHGAVERELVLTLDDLRTRPAIELPVTLECAGNLVGWGGVSNARWTGPGIAALLREAQVMPGAEEVVLVGADGGIDREAGGIAANAFARAIPLAKALEPSTILATRMNGVPLPGEHGGPLRAVVPGYYGMDSVKWIKEIFVSRQPFTGFYQTSRYYETRKLNGRLRTETLHRMRIKSQIARPVDQSLTAGPITIVGAAWTGESRIRAVKVSVDGGATWRPAKLGADDATSAWRLWFFEWSPAQGRYELVALATDARGDEQPLSRDPQIITPYANNWADRRIVTVR